MMLVLQSNPVPLQMIEDGTIRITGTRIPLETVIEEFRDGATAEEIVINYPTLELADVYVVIGYYLHHKNEVDNYMIQQEAAAEAIKNKIQANQDLNGIRERLLARQASLRGNDASAPS
ncbi:MAG: DUF433 domain-containing protein [Gemmataceae bacterium]